MKSIKRYSIAQARDQLASIVHELEVEPTVEITRRGQSVAVLLSKQEYDRLQSNFTGFWERYNTYTKQIDLKKLQIEPAELFGSLRESDTGRDIEL